MTTTITRNGLNLAVQGMQREVARVAKVTNDIQQAFTGAQNALAAESVTLNTDRASVVPAVEDSMRRAVLPATGDVAGAMVTLLQASTAYQANLAAARVTADVEREITRLKK